MTNNHVTNFQKVLEFMKVAGQSTTSRTLVDSKLTQFRLDLIKEEVAELEVAIANKDRKEVIDALADILYVVYGCGKAFDVDLDLAFDIVHKSNMSKFCVSQEEAQSTIDAYKKMEAGLSVTFRKENNLYVVYNSQSGKILKNINYVSARFDSML